MSMSSRRALRTGSMRAASWHWYTTANLVMPPSTASSSTMSAVSRPVGGRDSGEFSNLMASAGRLGTVPPGAGWPVRGQTGGAAGVEVEGAPGLLAVVLCEHPAITRAVAAARAAKRMPRARKDLLFMGTFPSGSSVRRPTRVQLPTRDDPPALGPRKLTYRGRMQATSGSIIGRMRSVAAGKPILVVEDEHNIASLVKLYLSNEGFSVA